MVEKERKKERKKIWKKGDGNFKERKKKKKKKIEIDHITEIIYEWMWKQEKKKMQINAEGKK